MKKNLPLPGVESSVQTLLAKIKENMCLVLSSMAGQKARNSKIEPEKPEPKKPKL